MDLQASGTGAPGRPGSVRITDVSPRDGLQNETRIVPTAQKLRLIELLCQAGVDEVEVTSFVSPQWVPQLADAAELVTRLADLKPTGVLFSALVPNERGLSTLLSRKGAAGKRVIDKVAVFTAASETFSRRNTNASIEETLQRFAPVIRQAHAENLLVRGYVSCAIRCPFEGDIEPRQVVNVARRLVDLQVDELDLADTIGAGTPETTGALLEAVREALSDWRWENLTLHLHDTNGRAAECAKEALAAGIRSFDAAAGGLGGCPYASTPGSRAPGNLSTEGLLAAIAHAGFKTGVDPAALQIATDFARMLAPADCG